jgi:hypothetical protein
VSVPVGGDAKVAPSTITKMGTGATKPIRDTKPQGPCTISFVSSTYNASSNSRSPSASSPSSALSSSSLASGLWIGIALALTSSGCSSTSGCDGTALDWAMLASLAFQLFFLMTVVWQELRGFCGRPNNTTRRLGASREWFWLWYGNWLRNWKWWDRLSTIKPWWHGNTPPSFRRLG